MNGSNAEQEFDKFREKYSGIVYSIAFEYARRCCTGIVDCDDLVQEGMMALYKIMPQCDHKRNVKAYVKSRVRGAIKDYIAQTSRIIRLNKYAIKKQGNPVCWVVNNEVLKQLEALMGTGREKREEERGLINIWWCLKQLSEAERVVIEGIYARGETQVEVSRRIGKSKTYVGTYHKRALAKLEQILRKEKELG